MQSARLFSLVYLVSLLGCSTADGPGPAGPKAYAPAPANDASLPTESPDAEVPGDAAAPTTPWSELSDDERGAFMAREVMPAMRTLFQEFDPDAFATFTCRTCHGETAREVGFHMPNGLSALNPDSFPNPYSDDPDTARYAAFMRDEVVPQMAAILGEPLFDPTTGEGFGCLNCHDRKDSPVVDATDPPPMTVAWADMDHEQRSLFMREMVSPRMKTMFQAFDPERFVEFGCRTCHGTNARDVAFAMPNGIAPIDPMNFPRADSEDPEVARFVTFMREQVTPAMVEMLQVEPFSAEHRDGFGCFSCHGRVSRDMGGADAGMAGDGDAGDAGVGEGSPDAGP